jgi:hypothetical protein
MGWWNQIWRNQAQDWIVGWLDPSQTPNSELFGQIEPESAYLNIALKSARIVDVRKGFKTFYGTVHSFIRLPSPSQQNAEFNVVNTPTALKNVDAAGINRVIQLNQRLLGPVPYLGGDLEIEVGLFSIASSDLALPYLTLLESLSKTAGVSFISSAVPFVSPILEGVKLLAGSDKDSILEVGVSMTEFSPRQGYFVAIRAPKGRLDVKTLKVDASDFRLLGSDGAALVDFPYLVLEVRGETYRSDWFKVPEIGTAYREIQELYRANKDSDTEAALGRFRRMALTCNDLLVGDARKLADKVDAMYRAFANPDPVRRGGPKISRHFPELKEVNLYGS